VWVAHDDPERVEKAVAAVGTVAAEDDQADCR
jgi:tRNA dimethylallyltransferase